MCVNLVTMEQLSMAIVQHVTVTFLDQMVHHVIIIQVNVGVKKTSEEENVTFVGIITGVYL